MTIVGQVVLRASPGGMVPFAKTLIIRERRPVEGAMGDEWGGDLSRDIDLLIVVEDMLVEYLSEGRRREQECTRK